MLNNSQYVVRRYIKIEIGYYESTEHVIYHPCVCPSERPNWKKETAIIQISIVLSLWTCVRRQREASAVQRNPVRSRRRDSALDRPKADFRIIRKNMLNENHLIFRWSLSVFLCFLIKQERPPSLAARPADSMSWLCTSEHLISPRNKGWGYVIRFV